MQDCKPMDTPLVTNQRKVDASTREVVDETIYKQLVCFLMYLVKTRPDICFSINQLSQFMMEPTKIHQKVAKHVLRYLIGTIYLSLWYIQTDGVKFQGFTNVDWARSPLDNKTHRGLTLVPRLATISWHNRKQRHVALSSVEVEYMASSQVTCKVIWIRKILVGLFSQEMEPTLIHYCKYCKLTDLLVNQSFY